MWELDYKESWAPKNLWFWTGVLEKTLESPLDYKEIQAVHPKGDQSWVFIGRTDVEAETPVHWPPDVKSWLIWKDPDDGKDWRREEEVTTEEEMVGRHQLFNGHEFGWPLGVGDGQGGLACCGPCGCKESDMTEGLNWTELSSKPTLPSDWPLRASLSSFENCKGVWKMTWWHRKHLKQRFHKWQMPLSSSPSSLIRMFPNTWAPNY